MNKFLSLALITFAGLQANFDPALVARLKKDRFNCRSEKALKIFNMLVIDRYGRAMLDALNADQAAEAAPVVNPTPVVEAAVEMAPDARQQKESFLASLYGRETVERMRREMSQPEAAAPVAEPAPTIEVAVAPVVPTVVVPVAEASAQAAETVVSPAAPAVEITPTVEAASAVVAPVTPEPLYTREELERMFPNVADAEVVPAGELYRGELPSRIPTHCINRGQASEVTSVAVPAAAEVALAKVETPVSDDAAATILTEMRNDTPAQPAPRAKKAARRSRRKIIFGTTATLTTLATAATAVWLAGKYSLRSLLNK